jgi:hypothetical protein
MVQEHVKVSLVSQFTVYFAPRVKLSLAHPIVARDSGGMATSSIPKLGGYIVVVAMKKCVRLWFESKYNLVK